MDDSDEEVLDEVKVFLKDFPQTKLQLEEHIKELRLAADKIDKIHRNCTRTYEVGSSVCAVSGILNLARVALFPVAGGVSLALSAGMGLGAVAAVSAYVFNRVRESQVKSELHNVEEETNKILVLLSNSVRVVSSVGQLQTIFNNINSPAFRPAKAKSGLISTIHQSKKDSACPVLAVTENASKRDVLSAGGLSLMEIAAIVQDSMHSSNGAKATTAEKLREKAQHLEEKLQELSKIYQILLETDTQSRT